MERRASCQNFILKEESYLQLLIGVTRNVRSGWGSFHSNIQLPHPVQGGGGEGELQKERSATRKENQDT